MILRQGPDPRPQTREEWSHRYELWLIELLAGPEWVTNALRYMAGQSWRFAPVVISV